MLGTKNIVAFVPTTDFEKARAFYENVLGLKPDPEMTGERWTEYPVGAGVNETMGIPLD